MKLIFIELLLERASCGNSRCSFVEAGPGDQGGSDQMREWAVGRKETESLWSVSGRGAGHASDLSVNEALVLFSSDLMVNHRGAFSFDVLLFHHGIGARNHLPALGRRAPRTHFAFEAKAEYSSRPVQGRLCCDHVAMLFRPVGVCFL